MNEKELQRISQQAARVGVNVGTMAEAFRRVAEMSVPTGGLDNNSPSAQPEVLACGEGVLNAQPEIIRCKDCKHYKVYEYTGRLACHYVIGGTVVRNPDDFCSRAERRTDE